MSRLSQLYIYRKRLIMPYIHRLLKVLDGACYLMSVIFIIAMVYEHGFRISPPEREMIHSIYRYTWMIFLSSYLLHILFDFGQIIKQYNIFTWTLNAVLAATALPHLFGGMLTAPLWQGVWNILDSHLLHVILLTTLSMLQLSMGIIGLLTRRVNPAFILSGSFFIFIIIGTGMLMLPRATYEGISIIDAIFMSTSAICVTGLSTVDVAATFTPMGILFILCLIQIGGLGVMTLTSFFAMFFMGNSSLHNQVMIGDMVSSKSLSSLFTTLLYILGFTFIIELAGAAIILLNIHNTMGMSLQDEIAFSLFHSVSAFCNAGFSTLPQGLGTETLMRGHNIFYLTITALIVLGSVGFPILVNLYETLKYYLRELWDKHIMNRQRSSRKVHLYDINTQIVLIMTIVLLVGGTAAIAILEWNSGFAGMPALDKFVHSLFNAACPRTAGFSSVAISSFSMQTILILVALMIIGGGAQSTAGGIKVNVFAVILLNLRAILYGREEITVLNRELSHDSIRRSNSTIVLYMLFVAVAIFLLSIFEPQADFRALFFEAISALSTVGSSLDLTPTLGGDSKVVIIALMFIGRVGVLTIAMSLVKQRKVKKYKYPSGNIIIN